MLITNRESKQVFVDFYNKILFSSKKKWIIDICSNMNEYDNIVSWKKPHQNNSVFGSIYTKF